MRAGYLVVNADATEAAHSGERTRPRVLVLAPSPKRVLGKADLIEKSSRSRGRDRQHAGRMRSPDKNRSTRCAFIS